MLAKFQKITVRLLLASAVSMPALAAGPAVSPQALRGVWFEDTELGRHHCLQYSLRQTGELIPGTLVVADTQIAEAQQGVQETLLFLTQVAAQGEDAWQVSGLSDAYPYQAIKELQIYGFSLRNQRLYRSMKQVQDGKEFLRTQVYARCV